MPTLESAVYAFEGLLPDLPSPPIAARRALDHAGLRLSVDGWRSLGLDERQRLTLLGVADRVDVDVVVGLLRRASPDPQRIPPVADPDPTTPPEALARALEPARAIDSKRWARLRAVDRYALTHTYRRAVARSAFSILGEAFDAVVATSVPAFPISRPPPPAPAEAPPGPRGRPPAGGYRPPGHYSTVTAPLETRDTVKIPRSPLPPSLPPEPSHRPLRPPATAAAPARRPRRPLHRASSPATSPRRARYTWSTSRASPRRSGAPWRAGRS